MSADASREAEDARHDEPDRPGETVAERADRNVIELLNELRVVGLGVQVLFGFLLTIPFATRFTQLNQAQRDIYLATVLLAALSTALLVAPVAYHRLLFRRHEKESVVRTTSMLAIAGLATVGLAVTGAVVLVVTVYAPGAPAIVITGLVVRAFAGLWFALPLSRRDRDDRQDGEGRPGGANP